MPIFPSFHFFVAQDPGVSQARRSLGRTRSKRELTSNEATRPYLTTRRKRKESHPYIRKKRSYRLAARIKNKKNSTSNPVLPTTPVVYSNFADVEDFEAYEKEPEYSPELYEVALSREHSLFERTVN